MGAGVDHGGDCELVRAVLARAPGSVEALVERLRCIPRILSMLNQRVGCPFDAEDMNDLRQDVLMTFWRRVPEYTGRAALETWAYGFCLNAFKGALERRRTRRHEPLLEQPEPESRAADPLTEDYEILHKGLDRLEEREARVIRLKYYDELTFEAIGIKLGISSNTAKTCFYRGMRRLGTFLETDEGPGKGDHA